MIYLNKNLKYLREKAGYTQEDVAAFLQLKMGQNHYSHLERKGRPRIKHLISLAELYNTPIHDLCLKDIAAESMIC